MAIRSGIDPIHDDPQFVRRYHPRLHNRVGHVLAETIKDTGESPGDASQHPSAPSPRIIHPAMFSVDQKRNVQANCRQSGVEEWADLVGVDDVGAQLA